MHAGGKKKKNVPIESAKYFLIERPKRGGRFLDLRETCESHRGSVIVVIFVKRGGKKTKKQKNKATSVHTTRPCEFKSRCNENCQLHIAIYVLVNRGEMHVGKKKKKKKKRYRSRRRNEGIRGKRKKKKRIIIRRRRKKMRLGIGKI